MHKKTKIFISLLTIFIITLLSQSVFAKYVIESTNTAFKINIDRCPPSVQLVDISSSNTYSPALANHTHLITVHIKIIESNLIRNDLSPDTIKINVGNRYNILEEDRIFPDFKSFSLVSENASEKIYEISFTNVTGNGALSIVIPEGVLEDKSRIS